MKKGLLFLVIIFILLGGFYFIENHKKKEILDSIQITFNDTNIIEYKSAFNGYDLVLNHEGDIVRIEELDTSVLGEHVIHYTLEKEGLEKEFEKTITVVDTLKPIIELNSEIVIIKYEETYDLKSNIKKVYDEVDGDLEYEIIGSIDNTKPNDYKIIVSAKDINGNVSEKEFTVTVKEKSFSVSDYPVIDNIENIQPYYVNGILVVNKNHPLPSTFGGKNATAEKAFQKLVAGAKADGLDIWVRTSYRSYSTQKAIYNGWVEKYGEEQANRISAKPGYSEHQSGLAFDVISLSVSFADTPEGIWLKDHCAEYGFIIRYLEGKEHITGYSYEPWHIRYVGTEHSIYIMENGLTLEEYLGIR